MKHYKGFIKVIAAMIKDIVIVNNEDYIFEVTTLASNSFTCNKDKGELLNTTNPSKEVTVAMSKQRGNLYKDFGGKEVIKGISQGFAFVFIPIAL